MCILCIHPVFDVVALVRYTMERPRFTDHLDAIKFICKDFWSELFKKQIDNLKTNHRVLSRIDMNWRSLCLCRFDNITFVCLVGYLRVAR